MKRTLKLILVLVIAAWLSVDEGFAWRGGGGRGGGGGGRGGGGGGGGMRGGGGGGFQGGAPAGGFSGGGRPAAGRPAGGGGAAARPGGGGVNRGPSFSSPGGARPAARPAGGAVAGGRPSIQPGTRPPIGGGAGAGAATRPAVGVGGARPGIGAGQLPAGGAGAGVRPGTGAGQRPAIGAGIGAGQRPATLPGLGSGTGLGSGNRAQNLPASRGDRAASLQDRMAGGDRMNMGERQGQRQDARGERQQGRQDNRGQAREDWQNWAGDHGDWYHGGWAGGWYPGAGFANYPVAAALGVTWWGVNRLSYAFGMGGYSNPYYDEGGGGGYDYSEPVAAYQPVPESQPAATTETTATAAAPGASAEGMSLFDQSRAAFATGDYKRALELCNQTLKTMPNDAVVHEFRSLILFAQQNYRDSAAAAYAVLSAGPGWDWTTLSSLYGTVADYTTQLRALETFVKNNPNSSDGHFLLAYHYLTTGHPDAARTQLREVDKLTPKDRLVSQLLGISSAPDEQAKEPARQPPIEDDKLVKAEQIVGVWTASGSGGSNFQMTLEKDSAFSWKFTSGKKSEQIKGVFAVEQNNLALEVDDGSVLLAEIALSGNQLRFKVIGGEAGDPGLTFLKAK